MQLEVSMHDDDSVVTVSGTVDAGDVSVLRMSLVDALDQSRRDVLLDMRQAGPVDDAAVTALSAARSRAKCTRRRIVVIDSLEGACAAVLRRNGMHFRIPIYLDLPSATAVLAGDRASRGRLTRAEEAGATATPAYEPAPSWADDEQLAPVVEAARAASPPHRRVRPSR